MSLSGMDVDAVRSLGNRLAVEASRVDAMVGTVEHDLGDVAHAIGGFFSGVDHDAHNIWSEVDKYGGHLALPLIRGIVTGLVESGLDTHGGRRVSGKAAAELDDSVTHEVLTEPAAQSPYADMRELSNAVGGTDPGATTVGNWAPEHSIKGPQDTFAELYKDPKTNEYALVFRGSVPGDAPNWAGDTMSQANAPTSSGQWAVEQGQYYQTWIAQHDPGAMPTFAGHSLGGSQAAMATENSATTFNAAGVGDGNYAIVKQAYGGTPNQDLLHAGHEASGAQITLTSNSGPFNAHRLSAFPTRLTSTNTKPGWAATSIFDQVMHDSPDHFCMRLGPDSLTLLLLSRPVSAARVTHAPEMLSENLAHFVRTATAPGDSRTARFDVVHCTRTSPAINADLFTKVIDGITWTTPDGGSRHP